MEKKIKSRIPELDLLRVVAMFFVITYHFGFDYTLRNHPIFNLGYLTANYDFGNLAVTLFVVLSGGLLYKSHGTVARTSLKGFYFKRALAIYPPFWICNLYVLLSMAKHWMGDGSPFYAGHPAKLLLTLVGADGYAKTWGIDTYFFCGEWFVGAIVFLYLLYPLLAYLYKKFPLGLITVLTIAYGTQFVFLGDYLSYISELPVTLLLKFCLGFFLLEHLEFFRKVPVTIAGIVIFALLSCVEIQGILKMDFLGTIASLGFFAVVFFVAPWLLKFKPMKASVQKLTVLSYCVFLVQHVVISWTQMGYMKLFEKMQWQWTPVKSLALLFVTSLIIFVVAYILWLISGRIVSRFSRKKNS